MVGRTNILFHLKRIFGKFENCVNFVPIISLFAQVLQQNVRVRKPEIYIFIWPKHVGIQSLS